MPKHGTGRTPRVPPPDSPEGRELGLDDRNISSGIPHIIQEPVKQQAPKVPQALAPFRGDMAHGVPADNEHWVKPGRPPLTDAPVEDNRPEYKPPEIEEQPVPVYIVQQGDKAKVRTELFTKVVTVPANSSAEPVRAFSKDPQRTNIYLLNETAQTVRFGTQLSSLISDDGALLPGSMTNYLRLKTQGEIWLRSTSSSTGATISAIVETELPLDTWAGDWE